MTFPITSHYQSSGPCSSFNCLGHFKNVYDDDEKLLEWRQFLDYISL